MSIGKMVSDHHPPCSKYSSSSPRFPSPWHQALSRSDINVQLQSCGGEIGEGLNGETSNGRNRKRSGAGISIPLAGYSQGEDDPSPTKRAGNADGSPFEAASTLSPSLSQSQTPSISSLSLTSSLTSLNSLSHVPIAPHPHAHAPAHPLSPSHSLHPSAESLILSPTREGSNTKLIAERDKVGHIEYKLKLDARVGTERFERLVTQLRWRLSEGGGEAMYELGVLDDGTLIGIPRTLMSSSLRVLEMMAAELGATVMVLRTVTLSQPPPLGKYYFGGEGLSGRGGAGGGGVGAGTGTGTDTSGSVSQSQGSSTAPSGNGATSGNGNGHGHDHGRTRHNTYKARKKALRNERKDREREEDDRRKYDVASVSSEADAGMGYKEKKPFRGNMSSKQRKKWGKDFVWDTDSSEDEGEGVDSPVRVSEPAKESISLSPSVKIPFPPPKPLFNDGFFRTTPTDPSSSSSPAPGPGAGAGAVPASWKERNLARAHAAQQEDRWKAKREYSEEERVLIRLQRRERRRWRRRVGGWLGGSVGGSGDGEEEDERDREDVDAGNDGMIDERGSGNEEGLEDIFSMEGVMGDDSPPMPSKPLTTAALSQHDDPTPAHQIHQTHTSRIHHPPPQPNSSRQTKLSRKRQHRQGRAELRRLDLLRGDGVGLEDSEEGGFGFGGEREETDMKSEGFGFLGVGGSDSEGEEGEESDEAGGGGMGMGTGRGAGGFRLSDVVRRMVPQSVSVGQTGLNGNGHLAANYLGTSPTKTLKASSPESKTVHLNPASIFALRNTSTSIQLEPESDAAKATATETEVNPLPSPTDTITMPLDNLSLSFSQAEVCTVTAGEAESDSDLDLYGSFDHTSRGNGGKAQVDANLAKIIHDSQTEGEEDEPRLCVEALVVKKFELEDRLYFDFENFGFR